MKRFLCFVCAFFVLVTPASALIDGEIFGGYNFMGSYRTDIKTVDVDGWNYGARGHFTDTNKVFAFGIGFFVQKTPLEYDLSSQSYELTKTNIGPDAFFRLNLIPVLKPYVRAGVSFAEYLSGDTGSKSEWKYFNTCYAGAGLGLMPPIPVIDIMIFAEYLYNKRIYGDKFNINTVNVGIMVGF